MFNVVPYQDTLHSWAWNENAFNKNELNLLEGEALIAEDDARTGTDEVRSSYNEDLRRSKLRWLSPHDAKYTWLFLRLGDVVSRVNCQFFRFELSGFGEPAQLTKYEATNEGNYGWHQDYGAVVSRKLSLTLQLTEPSEYDGGELQLFLAHNKPETMKKERGMITLFPSFQLHRVTSVTRGTRCSLVVWVSGPPFR